MPFINDKFHMNPAYGRALESLRAVESEKHAAPSSEDPEVRDEQNKNVAPRAFRRYG